MGETTREKSHVGARMSERHYITDITQKAIISHNGMILLVHDVEDDLWELPGGRLNEGESLHDGLNREIKEEIGVNVEPTDVFDLFIFTGKRHHFAVVYQCTLLSSPDDIKMNEEISHVRWIKAEDVASIPMRPEYTTLLKKYFSIA